MKSVLIGVLAAVAAMAAEPGKLVVNGKSYALTHVYARKGPDPFEKTKMATYVIAVDRELNAATRSDEDALRELAWDGKLNMVEIQLNDGGISWSIRTVEQKGSVSGSQSPDPYKLTVAGGRVKGTVKMAEASKLGETEYYFEFPVDAAIEVKVAAPAPTAADKAAARTAASTKAYFAYQKALLAGDKEGIKRAVDPEKAAHVDTPEFPQMIKFIQEMQPKNIEVLRAVETGDDAELTLSGNGGADTGTVKMKRMNGAWLIMRESWKKK
jgi:hypothetical protein